MQKYPEIAEVTGKVNNLIKQNPAMSAKELHNRVCLITDKLGKEIDIEIKNLQERFADIIELNDGTLENIVYATSINSDFSGFDYRLKECQINLQKCYKIKL